tara:strand:- start:1151 stop:2797 length:1647 start_codon:yes stop_codon:yes gene_type:complete
MNSNNFVENKKNIISFFKQKKFVKVLKLGKKLLRQNPKDFELLYIIGLSSINLEDYIEAEKNFKEIILFKKSADLFYLYGNINKKLNNFDIAINSFNSAIKLNPNFSEAYNNLGNIQKKINLVDDAIKNYKKAISADKNNITAYFNLAVLFKELRKYPESKSIYEAILKVDNKNLIAKHDIGAINAILGNFDKARKYYKEVLEEDKFNYKSYKNYLEITKINEKDKIFKNLENIHFDTTNNQNKIDIFYSLSKGYFDQNKIKLGFAYLEKGKVLKKINSNFKLSNEKKTFKNLKIFFEKNYLKEKKQKIKCNKIPIFIVGMPRSGTTLIERILSAHSQIYGAGELNFLPKIIDKVYTKNYKNFEETIDKIVTIYSDQINKLSNRKYIIDKLPINFKWIGFIIKAFPDAKIIHMERNPMAVCWSNYKINFRDSGMEFTLSQKDIAEYYLLYHDLMKFWNEKFGNKIININYEKFVSDYKKYTKSLVKDLNLNWEENIKNYNKNNDSPVETASLHQVRGKISKNTSEQWKEYKNYLSEMQNILKINNINF